MTDTIPAQGASAVRSQALNVLFLTLVDVSAVSEPGIYTDLVREFRNHGHSVYVVCPVERRSGLRTALRSADGVNILRVRTGNITKVGVVEKAISTTLLEHQLAKAVARHLSAIKFDLLMYSTPPVTIDRVVGNLKNRYGCATYLMLKDIFPQNAVDLGLLRKGGLIWRHMRSRELHLYEVSDFIGCMSPANVRYLLEHNAAVDPSRVEVCPNALEYRPAWHFERRRTAAREQYNVSDAETLLVYGGNLGRPQGVSFLLEVMDAVGRREDLRLIVAGSGTEYRRIQEHLSVHGYTNVNLVASLPSHQYDDLLAAADIGLIFLDPRFTIPNFPSRLTAYMEAGLPVIAATDLATDLRSVLCESGSGRWTQSGDLEGFMAAVDSLSADRQCRERMGRRGRIFAEREYGVHGAYSKIVSHVRAPD